MEEPHLFEGLPSCDPARVIALVPIYEDSGVQCVTALLEKLTADPVAGVTVTRLSPLALEITFTSGWARGELTVVAGRRAVRLFRQGWSASTPAGVADRTRATGTLLGTVGGLTVSFLLVWLLAPILGTDGHPLGPSMRAKVMPFLFLPVLGAGLGTLVGSWCGRWRAARSQQGAHTLDQDVAAREALAARVLAAVKSVGK